MLDDRLHERVIFGYMWGEMAILGTENGFVTKVMDLIEGLTLGDYGKFDSGFFR